jgi:hypothetical protein
MAKDRTQGARFEWKYVVNEEAALRIRDFVRSSFHLDQHGLCKPNHSYQVHSLYLDSDDLKLYWGTINGDHNRFKLRLRFYDDSQDAPVFFEIKRWMNKSRAKKRAVVRRDAIDSLLAGDPPRPSHLVSEDTEQFSALQDFSERLREIAASPKLHIAYLREAYMPRGDNSARLTMDREVRSEPQLTARLSTIMLNPSVLWGPDIVLELKFTDRFPDLFRELVSNFGFIRCGAAKYVDSVATLGEDKFRAR